MASMPRELQEGVAIPHESITKWLRPRADRWGLSGAAIALLAFCLASRLVWVAVHPVGLETGSDFTDYHVLATTLEQHGVYGLTATSPQAFWPPGWPAVLAGLYSLTGPNAQLGAVVGVLLEWGAVLIAAVVAYRLLRPPFAIAALAIMCFYPSAIAYAPVLGTEHLAALLFTGLVSLVAFARPTVRSALAVGLLAGALLLVRGEYGAAMVVVVVIWLGRGVDVRRLPVVGAAAVAGALVFIAPWTARNADTFREFIPTSTNGGYTFYAATQTPRFPLAPDAKAQAVFRRLGVTSSTAPKAHENKYWRLGWQEVKQDPVGWLKLDMKRAYYQYGKESTMMFNGNVRNPWVDRFAILYWLALVALGLVGFAFLAVRWRRLPRAWLMIAASIVAVSFLKLFFIVNERDRLPLTYLLIVIAGLGGQHVFDWIAQRRPSRQTEAPLR
jgi:hypothetical protein